MSVWFGLRPSEVDLLHQPTGRWTWFIEDYKGTPVLWIYQMKPKSIAKDRRVKPSPCIYAEQITGLEIIQQGGFTRPLAKTTRHHFNELTNELPSTGGVRAL